MGKRKEDNKGFTLVELIVVLVILAILAAILVPALLGYIDRAKGSQLLLNGKNALNATQAELSSIYATTEKSINETLQDESKGDAFGHWFNDRIVKLSDLPSEARFAFKTYGSAAPSAENHSAWTVRFFVYAESDEEAIFFNGSSWEEGYTLRQAINKLDETDTTEEQPYSVKCKRFNTTSCGDL